MKRIPDLWFLLITAVALAPAAARTQQTGTHTVGLTLAPSVAVIRVALDGEVVLHSWDQRRVEVRVNDEITGRVIGFSNAHTRGDYAVTIAATDTDVVIAPRRRAAPVAIGFSTLKEHLRHDVYVPSNARICVQERRNGLTVEGEFEALDVLRPDGVATLHLRKGSSSAPAATSCQISQ